MSNTARLDYLDWARGLAVVLMIETHAFESWLLPAYRGGEWFWLSQFLGGLAAPLFLFLVGISLALVLDRLREKGTPRSALFRRIGKRGLWILFLAYAYRMEQSLLWFNWSEFFRVDILNCIGACTVLVGFASILFRTRRSNLVGMGLITAIIVVITPWVYPVQSGIPHFLLGYLNGDGHPYYFSLFSWMAFPLAGITFGYALLESRSRGYEARFMSWAVGLGILSYAVGRAMWFSPIFQYGFFDYSLTSPHYFLVRFGWMTMILYGAFHWCRWMTSARWSPMRAFGRTSLLVYWLHLEIVYGPGTYLLKRTLDVGGVCLNLLWLVPAMIGVAEVRLRGLNEVMTSVRLRLPSLRREGAVE